MAASLRTVSVTTDFVALESLPAKQVSILNNTGAALLVKLAGEDDAAHQISLSDGQSVGIPVVSNANEIEIKAAGAASGVQLVIE